MSHPAGAPPADILCSRILLKVRRFGARFDYGGGRSEPEQVDLNVIAPSYALHPILKLVGGQFLHYG